MVVKDVTPKEAANFVARAVERGVNYFDVAPYYGNAQQRLGTVSKPYRQCFLACKTLHRDAAGAARELNRSLRLLKTDSFDLYQLHALTDVDEVEECFGPGGAMEGSSRPSRRAKFATSASRHTARRRPRPPWIVSTSIRCFFH